MLKINYVDPDEFFKKHSEILLQKNCMLELVADRFQILITIRGKVFQISFPNNREKLDFMCKIYDFYQFNLKKHGPKNTK